MDETKAEETLDTSKETTDEEAGLEDDGSFDLDLGEDADESAGEDAEIDLIGDEEADGEAESSDGGDEDEEFDFDSEVEAALADDEDEESEENESEEKSDGGDKEGTPGGTAEDQEAAADDKATAPEKESAEARELAELKKKYEKLERRSKDALKSLGIDETDAVKGLEQLAREQSDMSEEEYKKDLQRRDAEEDEQARVKRDNELTARAGILARIEAKKKADLEAIHAAFPSSAKYEKLDDIPNFERFKVLRDAGNTPEEAYKAVSPGADDVMAAEAHKKDLAASKSHLKGVGGKNAGTGTTIPRSEYKAIKSMLGDDVSDAEIAKYYKKVKGN